MKRTTLRQLAELPSLDTAQLKEKWRLLFGGEPPEYNRSYLVKRLAHRIQELAYGGVSEATLQTLNGVLKATGHDALATPRTNTPKPPPRKTNAVAGTIFVREWNGERIEVVAVESGFSYQGQVYKSLSAVAREITGTNWNGPAFFGLRSSKASTTKRKRS